MARKNDLQQVMTALAVYEGDHGGFPGCGDGNWAQVSGLTELKDA